MGGACNLVTWVAVACFAAFCFRGVPRAMLETRMSEVEPHVDAVRHVPVDGQIDTSPVKRIHVDTQPKVQVNEVKHPQVQVDNENLNSGETKSELDNRNPRAAKLERLQQEIEEAKLAARRAATATQALEEAYRTRHDEGEDRSARVEARKQPTLSTPVTAGPVPPKVVDVPSNKQKANLNNLYVLAFLVFALFYWLRGSSPKQSIVSAVVPAKVEPVSDNQILTPSPQFYLCHSTLSPGVGMDAVLNLVGPHREWVKRLEERGILFAAGPLKDRNAPEQFNGGGLLIVTAESADAASELMSHCPYHANGIRTFTITPWQVSIGTSNMPSKPVAGSPAA